MLISPNTAKSLMNLNKSTLCPALENNGYQTDEDELIYSECVGVNKQGEFVYRIAYQNAQGDVEYGNVYVGVKNNRVVAEY